MADFPTMNLDEILPTFIVESRELLEGMEQALLQLEHAPGDAELIHAIFRAAHTIKGSAGLFGLEHLVAFTHHAENVLDSVRDGQLYLSTELVALLLQVCDHLGDLISHIELGTAPDSHIHDRSQSLVQALQTCQSSATPIAAAAVSASTTQQQAGPASTAQGHAASSDWHISLRCSRDMLRDGMDPLSLLHCLGTQGEIVGIATLAHELPDVAEMNPEDCYLGVAIRYRSSLTQEAIASTFEFVRESAQVQVVAPYSPLQDYSRWDATQTLSPVWADALVACGTLTPEEQRWLWPVEPVVVPVVVVALPPVPAAVPAPVLVQAPKTPQRTAPSAKTGETTLIRVNAETLDEHINLIGELIIASAGMHLAAAHSGQPQLQELSSVLARLVESVRGSALQLRMVQIGATFNKFQRVVREVSQQIGKDIALEISGAETELDKTVIEKIGDPLTHLVRNAMDHGIEPVAVRLACGKPAQGRVRLHACHDSGSIVIEVSDDGGGLPQSRLLAKAIERGLVRPDQVLTTQEIYQLIFEPGFSTAAQVNNLSGRGVGMDVVRRNITALRGSIDIQSVEGAGTTIRIRLPLTLAIIDGFLVTVGDTSLVIPLDMVEECIELTPQALEDAHGHHHLDLRGELLPVVWLRPLFGLPQTSKVSPEFAVDVLLGEQAQARNNVVVVRCGGRRAALMVDALQGEYQTVIRPLGPVFDGLAGMSGFTILGTGRVALIVDVPHLLNTVAGRHTHSTAPAVCETPVE